MRSENWEWTEEMREARLWLTDKDGRIIVSWGRVEDASHLCPLRAVEEMLGGRRQVSVVIVNENDEDAAMRKIWADGTVDLVVVEEFAGLFGPPREDVRTELLSELVVELTPQTWWVTNPRNDVTTVAPDWTAAVRTMIGIA